ncbi:MAG: cysteine desulfurase family protein, partial [Owenweeksia sp.]
MIYLDNAATTPLREEVKERMVSLLDGPFGNPSSTHQFGRKSRALVEDARRYIAKSLHCTPHEIIFTSGGTEADNMALTISVRDLGARRIITSPIEHPAVLRTAEALAEKQGTRLDLVRIDAKGTVDLDHLEELLKDEQPTLVSLMHGNNEVGNLLDIMQTGELVKKYGAYFHSDTVQTVGHFDLHLDELPVDFIAASAHKFYGPKGVGFLYMSNRVKAGPLIYGGGQERGMRSGTENAFSIAAMHTALQACYENLASES